MASYLEVISVVDHHKSTLKTLSVPSALIGDAQSCNVLIAEQEFLINDRYSLGGMTPKKIEEQIKEISNALNDATQMRLFQRLLQRRMAANQSQEFYVNPKREFSEYFCFLQAILDDTDLLTKVSNRDVECVAQLLNRLKSLSLGTEIEVVNFDDIVKDQNFAKNAAYRLLRQPDLYSVYQKTYQYRESDVDAQLRLCLEGHSSNIFVDTKEQNGCARVGQTKMFTSNFPYFLEHAEDIRKIWLKNATEVNQDQPEIDLHIHMISTIANAEEVYKNQIGPYDHPDELWFWISPSQAAYEHLSSFLAGFQSAVKKLEGSMELEVKGPQAERYLSIFNHSFLPIPAKISPHFDKNQTIAILRFKAGALNSRKSMITPYLPRIAT